MNDYEEFWRRSNEARGYATLGLTGLYVVNGGALTALINAFSTEILDVGIGAFGTSLTLAFLSFTGGIILTLTTSLLAFFSAMARAPIERDEGWVARVPTWHANLLNGAAEITGVLSLVAFTIGAISSAIAFW